MSAVASTDVTIIICTRNRAESLRETLHSLGRVEVPEGWKVELLVIDNGSSDHSSTVVDEVDLSPLEVRTVEEPNPGLSRARNTAVRCARGEVLLFTDDDVRFPTDWIRRMAEPVRSGVADAVAGGVRLAPHLRRPWQEQDPWVTTPLATTAAIDAVNPQRMVGANMAVARHVLDEVPAFDVDLDAGAPLGLGGETLVAKQLQAAGFRLVSAFDVAVDHHCTEDRLTRGNYLESVRKIGWSQGHIDYHWHQQTVRPIQLLAELAWRYGKLMVCRVIRYRDVQRQEGLPGWEMTLLTQIYHRQQLLAELGQPRKYGSSGS